MFFLFFISNKINRFLCWSSWVPIFLHHQGSSFLSDSNYQSFSQPASSFSDTSIWQPTLIPSPSLLSTWACSMLPECWLRRDRTSVFSVHMYPMLVLKRSYRNDSSKAPQVWGGHSPRPLWGWGCSTQVLSGCIPLTQPHRMVHLPRTCSFRGTVRAWAHSKATGTSHVSTTESEELCWACATLQRFVTCPCFRQRSKAALLTQILLLNGA